MNALPSNRFFLHNLSEQLSVGIKHEHNASEYGYVYSEDSITWL